MSTLSDRRDLERYLENDMGCEAPWSGRTQWHPDPQRRHELEVAVRLSEEADAERRTDLRAAHCAEPNVEPTILRAVTTQMAVFPPMIRSKYGPLLVVLETWSDGKIVATWPEARLYGEGETYADALRDLADNLGEFVVDMLEIAKSHRLAGAAFEQWQAINAMFDVVNVTEPNAELP